MSSSVFVIVWQQLEIYILCRLQQRRGRTLCLVVVVSCNSLTVYLYYTISRIRGAERERDVSV